VESSDAFRFDRFGSEMKNYVVFNTSQAGRCLIKKGETVAQIVNGVKLAQGEGFITEGVFIYGFPEETFEDRLRCFSLAQKLKLDRVRFNNLIPYPGTRVFEIAKEQNRLTIHKCWSNFNSAGAASSGIGSNFVIPYIPDGTTNGALQGSILISNIMFYLNFKSLSKMITPTRNPSGIGFELTFRQLFQPVKLINLFMAVFSMAFRLFFFLLKERECRRFLMGVILSKFPELDPPVHKALFEK
jgi:radical SAM superfamily enzyme YgiQ (UPF0313 family)